MLESRKNDYEKDYAIFTESDLQVMKAKASKIKDLEAQMAELKQDLDREVNVKQQLVEEL